MMDMYDDMAKKGRKGDTYIGHLTGGEMVIPAQILDADEGYLRKVLEDTLTELEVDPAQYTVGNEANNVNPETGQIEFFFKSIFRSVKKAVSSVLGAKKPKVDDSALKAQQARLDEQERKLEMQQSEAAMQKQASFRARRGRGGSYSLLGGQDTLG